MGIIIAIAVAVVSLLGVEVANQSHEAKDRAEIDQRYQVPCDANNCGKSPK